MSNVGFITYTSNIILMMKQVFKETLKKLNYIISTYNNKFNVSVATANMMGLVHQSHV